MIFEISEKVFNEVLEKLNFIGQSFPKNKDKEKSLGNRVTITSLSDDRVLFSMNRVKSATIQFDFRANVEKAGSTQVEFRDLYKSLVPTKGEASFYRFIEEKESGSLKVTFDVGSFVLSSHHLDDKHLKHHKIDTSSWDSITSINSENLTSSWDYLKRSLSDESQVEDVEGLRFDNVVALRSNEDGDVYFQTTDGHQISQYPLETNSEMKKQEVHLMDSLFFHASSLVFKGEGGEGNVTILRRKEEAGIQKENEDENVSSRYGVGRDEENMAFLCGDILVATTTENIKYPSFTRLISSEDDETLLLVPKEDIFKGTSIAEQMMKDIEQGTCTLKTSLLGSGKNKIEKSFPQLKNQKDLQGVLTLKTKYSSYDILVPFAKNFQEVERSINIAHLRNALERMESEAIILRVPTEDGGIPICVKEPDKKDKVKAFSLAPPQ